MAAAMYASIITAGNVRNGNVFHTNFQNFPVDIQTDIIPGFWTLDRFRYPNGTQPLGSLNAGDQNMGSFTLGSGSYWNYGRGIGGGAVDGLRSGSAAGSRAIYTPVAGSYGNMSLTVIANPEKLEGQGFAGAPQGMDIFIKYDEATKSGYGIRINRIPAFSTAVVINLIKYESGNITYLTNEGSALMGTASTGYSSYIGPSTIELKLVGTTLSAKVTTEATQTTAQHNLGFKHEFEKSVEVAPTTYGGINLYHFGGQGTDGRTVLSDLTVQWQ
jgi:hypothetical protein